MNSERTVFFVSDRTGITSEVLGHSLLTQFAGIEFKTITLAFIDSLEKTQVAVKKINQHCQLYNNPVLIFSTQINQQYRDLLAQSNGVLLDFFDTFIPKMEKFYNTKSSRTPGLSHAGGHNDSRYLDRIKSVDFALNNDDGISVKHYKSADIILVGVSRSGKTPTCLLLALQYGIRAANYPLIEQDLDTEELPKALRMYKHKLFGLTTNPTLLHKIRTERKSNSHYATLAQCQKELRYAQDIFDFNKINFIDTSQISIEEIASSIVNQTKLKRRY